MSTLGRVTPRRVARRTAAGLACILHAAWGVDDATVAGPLGGGDSVELEPVPPQATPRRPRAVFVCQDGGVPTFADRPCGSTSAQRSLVVEIPRPGAAATTVPPTPRASTRPRAVAPGSAAAADDDADARCAALRRQVDELNDRMRAGYSAREAARLWQRWRDAKERLRTARC